MCPINSHFLACILFLFGPFSTYFWVILKAHIQCFKVHIHMQTLDVKLKSKGGSNSTLEVKVLNRLGSNHFSMHQVNSVVSNILWILSKMKEIDHFYIWSISVFYGY